MSKRRFYRLLAAGILVVGIIEILASGTIAVAQISSGGQQAAGQRAPEQAPAPAQTHAPAQAHSPEQPQTQSPEQPQTTAPAAPPYQPKFAGDPARSEAESQVLGYMRVVLRAQREYKKRHDKFAPTLADLAGTGSFTKRMSKTTERGDYSVGFKTQKDGFILTMTPKNMDAEHRSFYAEDDGIIHADDQKPADKESPKVK